jgi:hypothetical protein
VEKRLVESWGRIGSPMIGASEPDFSLARPEPGQNDATSYRQNIKRTDVAMARKKQPKTNRPHR